MNTKMSESHIKDAIQASGPKVINQWGHMNETQMRLFTGSKCYEAIEGWIKANYQGARIHLPLHKKLNVNKIRCFLTNKNNKNKFLGLLKAPSSTLFKKLSLSSTSLEGGSKRGEMDDCKLMVVNLVNFSINNINNFKAKCYADFL
jgi:hypothetical protein